MSLIIKNNEAHNLAKQLAKITKITGESLAEAVTKAIRERLERVRCEREGRLSARLLSIGKDCAAHLKEPFRSIDHGDFLYNKSGRP